MTQAGYFETRRFNPGSLAMAAAIEFALIGGAVAWQIDVIPKPGTPTEITWVPLPKDPPENTDIPPKPKIPPKQADIYKPKAETELPPLGSGSASTIETRDWFIPATGTGPIVPDPEPRAILEPARARGDVRALLNADDYPESARRRNEAGTVRARLDIGVSGKVTGCTIVASSGSSTLDATTCRLLTNRARFAPAKDQNGQLVGDSYLTPKIVWTIERTS